MSLLSPSLTGVLVSKFNLGYHDKVILLIMDPSFGSLYQFLGKNPVALNPPTLIPQPYPNPRSPFSCFLAAMLTTWAGRALHGGLGF